MPPINMLLTTVSAAFTRGCGLCITLTISSLSYSWAQRQPSRIELVQSDAEIEQLVRATDADYTSFTVNSALNFADKRVRGQYRRDGVKAWEKADFDNNGYVDLLVTGTHYDSESEVICLMDMGNDHLVLTPFERQFYRACPVATVSYIGAQPVIDYADFTKPFLAEKLQGKRAFRLIYKYGGFVEYNPRASNTVVVDSISYNSFFAYHSITEERLAIGSAGQATYYSCIYPVLEPEKKTYESLKTTIDNQTLSELRGLAGYLAGQPLLPKYSVGGNHIPHTTIRVSYCGGQQIQVKDEGEVGTFGLIRLYTLLGQLRKTQAWQPVKP
jgi:hypothetical protein